MSYYPPNPLPLESKMIDVQYEIEKFRAELEFHEQKTRLIRSELALKIRRLSSLVSQCERARMMRDNLRRIRDEE